MRSFEVGDTQNGVDASVYSSGDLEPSAEAPEAIADRLLALYRGLGDAEYHGEAVSQLEHALQTAHLARDEGGTDEEVIAALLHDIGHIWPDDSSERTRVGVVQHEVLGAGTLRSLGFSDAVAAMVEEHVAAKRYLVATDEVYASQLSEASVESLGYQGGPMSQEEAGSFTHTPWFEEKVRLRLRDDRAKTPGLETRALEEYRELLLNHLSAQRGDGS